MNWTPYARRQPDVYREATLALDAILERLAEDTRSVVAEDPVDDSERALLFHYAQEKRDAQALHALASRAASRAAEAASRLPLAPSLHGGLFQVAWTLNHLHTSAQYARGELPELDSDLDDLLADTLNVSRWEGEWDLIDGLSGFAVFALARLGTAPVPSRHSLSRIVRLLGDLAVPTKDGIAWWTPAERVQPHWREEWPSGYVNFGLAHGSPGPATVLAQCAMRDIEPSLARRLAESAADTIAAEVIETAEGVKTCSWRLGERTSPNARHAWCYGIPGMALTLCASGFALQRADYVARAVRWMERIAIDDVARSGVRDPSLCHGSAGLAHLYARLGCAVGSEPLLASATAWCKACLASRRGSQGIAGFFCIDGASEDSEPRFLTGVTGIGLVLAAATSQQLPAWDLLLGTFLESAR